MDATTPEAGRPPCPPRVTRARTVTPPDELRVTPAEADDYLRAMGRRYGLTPVMATHSTVDLDTPGDAPRGPAQRE